MTVYKAIDLFAGIGGIRMGFDQAFDDDIETVLQANLMSLLVKRIVRTLMTLLKSLAILRKSTPLKSPISTYALQVSRAKRLV